MLGNQMRNVAFCLFRRPWLGVPFGVWVVVSVVYYWWLISRISILEVQNRLYRSQLKFAPEMRAMSVEPPNLDSSYNVPEIPDMPGTICEMIHISLVCMGKCTRYITPMLKSLLHHRQNPIHFHLIVDGASLDTISLLFDTWDLPDVKYTCYNAQSKLSSIAWIPNSHYSGVYPFVKLLYPEILPKDLRHVIVLDTDLTFLSDVAELWAMFWNMTSEQIIGLVENESNWYLEPERWPALGRGYNTGVMLLNLHNIHSRDINWTSLWNHALRKNLLRLNKIALGDQDIINAIIKDNPHIVYNISCRYNVQMSTKTLAKNCYGEDPKNVKVIHWNSPTRYSLRVNDTDYWRSLHHGFVNLDGNLLREKLHRCWPIRAHNVTGGNLDFCQTFRAASRVKLRTHIYYMEYSHRSDDSSDVTLVLQLSMDRLQFLERLVNYWEGPMSAAIYLADCDVNRFENFIQETSKVLSARKNIAYHLVFKHDAMHYPVNYLRNVALRHVQTDHVFLMDVDFVPQPALYQHLKGAVRAINPYPLKKCLVVPAFESDRYRMTPPRNKEHLITRMNVKDSKGRRIDDIKPFRAHEWPRGHRATNYTRWVTATAPYEVEWEPDYEPYLVCHRTIPEFDTRFSGFGWNKVSHSVELHAAGYRFVVLPAVFVVHSTHAPSTDITAFRRDPHYRVCLALLKNEFLEDLGKRFNVSFAHHKPGEENVMEEEDKIVIRSASKLTAGKLDAV